MLPHCIKTPQHVGSDTFQSSTMWRNSPDNLLYNMALHPRGVGYFLLYRILLAWQPILYSSEMVPLHPVPQETRLRRLQALYVTGRYRV